MSINNRTTEGYLENMEQIFTNMVCADPSLGKLRQLAFWICGKICTYYRADLASTYVWPITIVLLH